ncbi:hypothetical protein PHMEG_00028543 [Phytophthora megakarya]|uniref:Retrotransposon gag domain-containing protein n=1 Tax=Phytophthora megakarya TaxID=4795 RepID=A0A225V692_9STRA|nr:hypothetical protein PHMEG_00028543 [Phytophthora megakarya]
MILQHMKGHLKNTTPTYDGKFDEDLELWNFATEDYYANKRALMESDTSDFVTRNSNFSADCEAATTSKTWELFKLKLRECSRLKDFEYTLCERLFQLKQQGTIHEYVSAFQDLMSQSD